MRAGVVLGLGLIGIVVLLSPLSAEESRDEALWEAARSGDLATVQRLIGGGLDVDTRTEYGATALSYACDKGHVAVVRYLLEQGAEVNAEDEFYGATPMSWALYNDHVEVVKLLLDKGAGGADEVLTTGVRKNNAEMVAAALKSDRIDASHVAQARELAKGVEDSAAIVALLDEAEVKPADLPAVEVDPSVLQTYAGTYRSEESGMTVEVRVEEEGLVLYADGQPPLVTVALSPSKFQVVLDPNIKVSFEGADGTIQRAVVEQGGGTVAFPRVTETAEPAPPVPEPEPTTDVAEKTERRPAQNWPSFRGPGASGVADGQGAPSEWDAASGRNIRWKTPIPGMANSSPVLWGDRVFVTTAISGARDETFRSGLYGDVDSVEDTSVHTFKVYALDRKTGKILWENTVAKAVPGAKRHLKSTQANSTPVTDGKRVVTLFGTIGALVAYDMHGKLLWKTDVGVLDAGWFYDKSYQWGHASSPVIYDDLVIVQADVQQNPFIAAYRLSDGKQAWRTTRDEPPSWGSPTVYRGKERHELIANGRTVRGYDPATGKELWQLSPSSEVTVATPIVAHDLIYVTAGYAPVRPIYAIRPGAEGDISLPDDAESSASVAWSKGRGGTYMPTPIVYGDYLYTCANNGRLTCYEARTGEQVYRARVGDSETFSASPVAADGKLYFTAESGTVYVVKAGPEYEELARNAVDEICMATPLISDGLMVLRSLNHVYGIGAPPQP